MRVLFLGNSNDRQRPPGMPVSRVERIEQILAAELAEPVTMTWKMAWASEELPAVLDRWIDRHEPDLLYIAVSGYWYLYDSVPLRLRRRFGPPGRWVAGLAERAGESPAVSWNPVVRGLRTAATAVIGGEPNFTAREVLDRMEACTRVALRREGIAVGIRPDWGNTRFARTERGLARKERARRAMQDDLAAMCRKHHVYCEITELPNWQTSADRLSAAGDGLHQEAHGLEFTAQRLADSMLAALAYARHRGAAGTDA